MKISNTGKTFLSNSLFKANSPGAFCLTACRSRYYILCCLLINPLFRRGHWVMPIPKAQKPLKLEGSTHPAGAQHFQKENTYIIEALKAVEKPNLFCSVFKAPCNFPLPQANHRNSNALFLDN